MRYSTDDASRVDTVLENGDVPDNANTLALNSNFTRLRPREELLKVFVSAVLSGCVI